VSVLAAIVLGLSLTQTLTGIAQIARQPERLSAFLPHTLWVISLLLLHFLLWWSIWDLRDLEWNYARFIVLISLPLILFFLASVVLPRGLAGEAPDLKAYFFQVRFWLMSGFALMNLIYMLDGPIVFDSEPLLLGYRIPQGLSLMAVLVGTRTEKPGTHLIIALIVLATILTGSVVRFLPGAFS